MAAADSAATKPGQPHLLRVLGLGFGIAAVIGGTVGSGLMRAPGPVAAALGDPATILAFWALGGVLTLAMAMPMIELATALPRAGGPVVYAERAFGHTAGTLVGWADWLQNLVAISFISVVFGEYLQRLGIGGGLSIGTLAVLMLAVLAGVNCLGTRVTGASQTAGTVIKIAAIVTLVAALYLFAPAAPVPASPAPPLTFVAAVVAIRLISGTYGGYGALFYLGEEIEAPGRTIARATLLGLVGVTLVYVAVNAALLHALPLSVLSASTLPVADAIGVIAGPAGERLTTGFALLAVLTLLNITVMFTPRTLYAFAESGALPGIFARVTPGGAPWVAVIVTCAAAALLASSGTYLTIVAIYAPLSMVPIIATALAALKLRAREPELARPWRMPLYPLPVVLTLLVSGALLVAFFIEDTENSLWSLALLALGLPLLLRKKRTA
ncbi:APC family permease [Glacieibacterium frigidum]|nr:APC family permease [Glacieibacterium frigidum]